MGDHLEKKRLDLLPFHIHLFFTEYILFSSTSCARPDSLGEMDELVHYCRRCLQPVDGGCAEARRFVPSTTRYAPNSVEYLRMLESARLTFAASCEARARPSRSQILMMLRLLQHDEEEKTMTMTMTWREGEETKRVGGGIKKKKCLHRRSPVLF
jgi:hypothetical protein